VDAALEAFEPQRLSGEQVEISRDVPDGRAGIRALVRNHFIVKTRADADGVATE